MEFWFRKSIHNLLQVRPNLSRSDLSANIGVRGANVSVGPRGIFLNTGIPRTGVGFHERIAESNNAATHAITDRQNSHSSVFPRVLVVIAILLVIVVIAGAR